MISSQDWGSSSQLVEGVPVANPPPHYPSNIPQIRIIKDHKGSIKGFLGFPMAKTLNDFLSDGRPFGRETRR